MYIPINIHTNQLVEREKRNLNPHTPVIYIYIYAYIQREGGGRERSPDSREERGPSGLGKRPRRAGSGVGHQSLPTKTTYT